MPPGEDRDTPLGEKSDEQLVALHRDGRDDAFRELVGRYRPELFHFLIRFVNNRAAAEDLFQEAFLQVHISADTFDISKRFKPWLFTIAANKARDYLRKYRRTRAAPLDAQIGGPGGDGRGFIDLLEADLPLPDMTAERDETRALVRGVVGEMPDHLKEVLLLAYFQRLPYKEIAEGLGIPLGTVKSRLHAAVGTFAELWKARYEEDASETDQE